MSSSPPTCGAAPRPFTGPERGAAIALFLAAAFVFLFRLGQAPATISAEIRCWKTVSTMTETGNWLVPYRDGKPALNKPPMFYWAASAVSKLAGGTSYATLRTPSAIAGLALLLLTFFWARSLGGPPLALLSVALLVMIWRFCFWAREGTFEMMLALFTNLALFAFDRFYWTKQRVWTPLFFLCLAAAFMTKGPPALMVIGLPVVLFLAFRKELARAAKPQIALWSVAALALSLLWFAVILIRVPGACSRFYSEAVLPAGVVEEGHTALHYRDFGYFITRLAAITRLSAFLLPVLIWRGWTTRFWRDEPRLRFCGWIAGGLLLAFSAFPQKQEHYILPLFPALFLLTADGVLAMARTEKGWHWLWLGAPAVALGAATALSVVPLALFYHILLEVPLAPVLFVCIFPVVVGAGIIWAAAKRRWKLAGVLAFAATMAYYSVYFGSFEVVKRRFATGEIETRPDFNAARWSELKKKYPQVAKIFHRSSKFMKNEKEEQPQP